MTLTNWGLVRVGERFGIYEGVANGRRLCRCLSRWGIYQVIPEPVEESGSKSGRRRRFGKVGEVGKKLSKADRCVRESRFTNIYT